MDNWTTPLDFGNGGSLLNGPRTPGLPAADETEQNWTFSVTRLHHKAAHQNAMLPNDSLLTLKICGRKVEIQSPKPQLHPPKSHTSQKGT